MGGIFLVAEVPAPGLQVDSNWDCRKGKTTNRKLPSKVVTLKLDKYVCDHEHFTVDFVIEYQPTNLWLIIMRF